MATYFIGDIQGCYQELRLLLKQVAFSPDKDELWIAGDMVARGPDSYHTLKYLMSLESSVKAVLGNHDLHLLATYAGLKKAKDKDKLHALLSAPEIENMIEWLARQPLLRQLPNEQVYMSHAGLSPQWEIKNAIECANFAAKKLSGKKRNYWLSVMYGETPNNWQDVKTKEDKFRYTINALTRMRYCYKDGSLDFSCKSSPENTPKHLSPWFCQTTNQLKKAHWVFGHWAALEGDVPVENIYALDTGCVWGGELTLLRWHDKQYFRQQAIKN
ncbi:symmetrical bis(5'-nucleosyl)-tetraphosphatase [Thalassotalea sp. PP2-459]|uniref:symmetrical bis(5'-nucleosyl)-tetraphosphatase n=1 Tax=Thalassotalea sp. PP2-459 TaxID=1742724 RepID=UPI0009446F3D|nr:symmetrical bis(5'-nucleosyl)-tetraphosphatase [Thalassotalea sp. PP2-459]OKY26097.1 bis(5'-nucleosyl)-tetraphosphatase (symmetrical) [Thalassotalea sp. PP2-459]